MNLREYLTQTVAMMAQIGHPALLERFVLP